MNATAENDNKDLWVFGYGSLMWRPGFDYLDRVPARLVGLHRALCVFSFVHRGTPERPGGLQPPPPGRSKYEASQSADSASASASSLVSF